MKNKLYFGVFGLAIAVITAGGSILAATHPEKISEVKELAWRAISGESQQLTISTDLSNTEHESEVESEKSGDDDASTVKLKATSAQSSDTAVTSKNRGKDDDGEREDEDDDSGHSSSSAQTTTTAPVPTTTATAPAPVPMAQTFTMAQVATHNVKTNCYTVINGVVYNLTPFISSHPGGVSAISSLCGIDGEAEFQAQHGGQGKPEKELASLKIGVLVQ